MTTAIWWIRRDLRLTDNQALATALAQADEVIPVFIFDPDLLDSPYVGPKRLAFLQQGLRYLDAALRERSSRLIIRRGRPQEELRRLLDESNASAVFAEADVSPYARQRDKAIAERLPLRQVAGLTVYPPDAILKADGEPYIVYTPYGKTWKALSQPQNADIIPAPDHISTPSSLHSETIPDEPVLPSTVPFSPGEAEAHRRLQNFVNKTISDYADRRNHPADEGTSGLSPYLRFGMLSARQAVVSAWQAVTNALDDNGRQGAETWLNELIWREFYISILHHFPDVRRRSFRLELEAIPWDNDEAAFTAWCKGRIGYPIVDAGMRQLDQTGWMHNRVRMIVASFLVKDLLIDWRWGERWFMQQLIDGDPATNNGGWQWTAGTGTDAAPYFRVFNPTLQSKKFDPDGIYIRRWVPELAGVPNKYIHEPAQMPFKEQRRAGCLIGQDYPEPLIDHASARKRVLEVYDRAKTGI